MRYQSFFAEKEECQDQEEKRPSRVLQRSTNAYTGVVPLTVVIDPLHSSEARGAIGSLNYNTWRGIRTVRTTAGPGVYYSAAQEASRAIAIAIQQSWQDLTDDQRAMWRAYADAHYLPYWTGTPLRITAHNWYLKCNYWLSRLGEATIDTPPAYPAPPAPQSPTITNVAGYLVTAWSATPKGPDASFRTMVWCVPAHPPSQNPPFAHATFEDSVDYTDHTYQLLETVVGTVDAWLQTIDIRTGLRSPLHHLRGETS